MAMKITKLKVNIFLCCAVFLISVYSIQADCGGDSCKSNNSDEKCGYTKQNDSADLTACTGCREANPQQLAQATSPEIIKKTPVIKTASLEITGTVVVEVTILPDGTIGYLEIKESIPDLDNLALETIQQWEFSPAYREDEPVIGFLNVAVEFNDEEELLLEDEDIQESVTFLRSEIACYLAEQKILKKHTFLKLPYQTYSENYHLYSPSRTVPLIKRNDFTLIPAYTSPFHTLQNHLPFFESQITPHKWSFTTEKYNMGITLVDAYLGLGYLDMNYGHINIMKNDTFDVENLQFTASHINEDGYWMGHNERKSNIMTDIYYPFGNNSSLRLNAYIVNQITPVSKFRLFDIPVSAMDESIRDYSIYFTNPIIDIGIRYERLYYKSEDIDIDPERKLFHFNLKRALSFYDHTLSVSWDRYQVNEEDFSSMPYLTEDENDLFTFNYGFDSNLLKLSVEGFTGLNYKYYVASEMRLAVVRELLNLSIGYMENEKEEIDESLITQSNQLNAGHYYYQDINKDIYGGILFRSCPARDLLRYSIEPRVGMQEVYQHQLDFTDTTYTENSLETIYVRGDYLFGFTTGKFDWDFYGYGLYYDDNEDIWFLPKLYARNVFECRYRLPYNNAISVGLIHHFTSNYAPAEKYEYKTETALLDAFARISLTEKFDIQADVVNILETESLFGMARAGLHFNVGIRWLFFN